MKRVWFFEWDIEEQVFDDPGRSRPEPGNNPTLNRNPFGTMVFCGKTRSDMQNLNPTETISGDRPFECRLGWRHIFTQIPGLSAGSVSNQVRP